MGSVDLFETNVDQDPAKLGLQFGILHENRRFMIAMVGDPGIEPGAGLPGGVTVRCRTLQLVAHTWVRAIQRTPWGVKRYRAETAVDLVLRGSGRLRQVGRMMPEGRE